MYKISYSTESDSRNIHLVMEFSRNFFLLTVILNTNVYALTISKVAKVATLTIVAEEFQFNNEPRLTEPFDVPLVEGNQIPYFSKFNIFPSPELPQEKGQVSSEFMKNHIDLIIGTSTTTTTTRPHLP